MKILLFFANAVVFGQVYLENGIIFHLREQKSVLENDSVPILILKLCALYYSVKYAYLLIKKTFSFLCNFLIYFTLLLGIICSIYYLNSVSPETKIFAYGVRSVELTLESAEQFFIVAENIFNYFVTFCAFLVCYNICYYIYRFIRFIVS